MNPREVTRFAKMALDAARTRLGPAWSMMGEEIRHAMIAAEALNLASGWDNADRIPASVVVAIRDEAVAAVTPDYLVAVLATAKPAEARVVLEALDGWVENALADEPEGLDPKQLAAGEALLERLNLARADLAK